MTTPTAIDPDALTIDTIRRGILADAPVTVLGFARSGVALTRFLADAGARVTVYDGRPLEAHAEAIAELDGRDVTSMPPYRRTQAGLGRSFQVSSVFPLLTVGEYARLAAEARLGGSLSVVRRATRFRPALERAASALERVGLAARSAWPAWMLSHGDKRKLEIAMLLAPDAPPISAADRGRPLVLLDANWRHAAKMRRAIEPVDARAVPPGWLTAYPRRSKIHVDPEAGLATVEALFAACCALGLREDALLRYYPWRDAFLALNRDRLPPG